MRRECKKRDDKKTTAKLERLTEQKAFKMFQ